MSPVKIQSKLFHTVNFHVKTPESLRPPHYFVAKFPDYLQILPLFILLFVPLRHGEKDGGTGVFRLLRHVAAHLLRPSSLPDRIFEDVHLIEIDLFQILSRMRELLLGLSHKAHDHIGGQRRMVEGIPQDSKRLAVFFGGILPVHPL